MGFRNKLTTVSGVDTGPSVTGPGVRLYQQGTGYGAVGVLEMRDGLGNPPATLTSRAYVSQQPDGSVTEQGGITALRGGDHNGTTGPELDLIVQGAAAGGYEAIARLVNAARLEVPQLVPTAAPAETVNGMANKPTTGLFNGREVWDSVSRQPYTFDGSNWRNPLAMGMSVSGVPGGAYITARAGSAVVGVPSTGNAVISIGAAYTVAPLFAIVTPGDTAGTLGQVIAGPGSFTPSAIVAACRTAAGATITSGNVRINWLCVGYNT